MGRFKDGYNGGSGGNTLLGSGFLMDSDSYGAAGYLYFSNGLHIQWGRYSSTGHTKTLTIQNVGDDSLEPFDHYYAAHVQAIESEEESGFEAAFLSGHQGDGSSARLDFPMEDLRVRHTLDNSYASAETAGGIGVVSWLIIGKKTVN